MANAGTAGPSAPGAPAAASAASPAAARSPAQIPAVDPKIFDSANLLLFSIALDSITLTEGLACYGSSDDPLVPVGELTRLLEADVDVSLPQARIVGQVGDSRRSIIVDLGSGVARVGGTEIPLAAGDAALGPGDIYVRLSLLEKLLPIKATVDGEALSVALRATEKFPVQSRLARLGNRPNDGSNVVQEKPLVVEAPYRLFSLPGADVQLGVGARSTAPRYPLDYTIRLGGDALYSNFQGYFSSDESGHLASARALLQRRSVQGRLFGPVHAREVNLGDVYTPGMVLGPGSVGGRGFSFSTVPFDETSVFNRIDLRGELPPGYDVELYVNDVLRGTTNQAANGLYEFLSVPLASGMNVIRVVTYGPRGERNETLRVINVGSGTLRRGEATFQFGVVQQNTTLFKLGQQSGPPEGSQATQTIVGRPRIVGQLNYGVTELMTVTAAGALIPKPGGGQTGVGNLGLRTSFFGVATELEAAGDSNGGMAGALGLAGAWHGISVVGRHAEYRNGFVDENALGSGSAPLERRSEFTIDANASLRGRIIPVSLRVLRNGYADGTDDLSGSARMSTTLADILWSTGVEYTRPSQSSGTLTGYLTASTYKSLNWQIRATFDYQLKPVFRARLFTVSVDHPISDDWLMHMAISQPIENLAGTSYSLSAVDQTRFGDLSLIGEYSNQQHAWRIATQWSFGLGYNPGSRRYQLGRSGPGSGGSMLLDAFVDDNGDGLRQPDEAPVSKVALDTGGVGKKKLMTGPDGRLLVNGMGAGPTATARVSLDAIDDPSVQSPPSTIQIGARPGSITHVLYPLQPTGDVGVHVELVRDDGQKVGLSATRVRLLPARGGAPVEGMTEFDGSAVFNQLPSGTYKVALDPDQAAHLRMHMVADVTIVIKSDGSFTNDAVVEVKFDAAADDKPAAAGAG